MEVAVVMVSLVISFSDNDEFSSSPVLIVVVPSSSIISETKSLKGSVKKITTYQFLEFFPKCTTFGLFFVDTFSIQ